MTNTVTAKVERKHGSMPRWAVLGIGKDPSGRLRLYWPWWSDINGERFLTRFIVIRNSLVTLEITRELGNSEAMKPFVKREILPGDLEGEALDNLIRDGAMSMYHPTCTAKMGQDDLSVVDAQLRVYGVKKLRIADGSIMPTITTGNTHAPCVIIGERLAEILNADPADPRGAARQRRRLVFSQKESSMSSPTNLAFFRARAGRTQVLGSTHRVLRQCAPNARHS